MLCVYGLSILINFISCIFFQISQLNHNLSVKDNLLRIFLRDSDQITDINDDEVSVLSSGRASPVRSQQGLS